jgi:hypothetical protein
MGAPGSGAGIARGRYRKRGPEMGR